MLAENSLPTPVSLMQALMAFTTSGMTLVHLAEHLVALRLILGGKQALQQPISSLPLHGIYPKYTMLTSEV